MVRFSVKKPFTVLVGVILLIIFGILAFRNLSTDLLPEMSLPYAIVMTTYPGANPETVEMAVTGPVEASMATVSNIEHITSTSGDNYSVVILQFAEDANMDSAVIEIRENLDMIKGYWPSEVSNPIIMKINPTMLPVMIFAMSGQEGSGLDIGDVSELYNNTVEADLESIEGVASANAQGLLEESIQVIIREDKVEKLNDRLMGKIDDKFEEAEGEINKAENQLQSGQSQITNGMGGALGQMADAEVELSNKAAEIASAKAQMDALLTQLDAEKKLLEAAEAELADSQNKLNETNKKIEALNARQAELTSKIQSTAAEETELQAKLAALMSPESVAEYTQLLTRKTELENQKRSISADTSLTDEEKAAQIASIDALIAPIDTRINERNAEIAAVNQKLVELNNTIEPYRTELTNIGSELATAIAQREIYRDAINDDSTLLSNIARGKAAIEQAKAETNTLKSQIATGQITLNEAQKQLSTSKVLATIQASVGSVQILTGLEKIDTAKTELEKAKESARDSAALTNIITVDMINNILTAQNFSMPAGYVTEDGIDYLVRVGDKLPSVESLENLVLMDLSEQEMGIIYLKDVADVFMVDNSADNYAKLDGQDGVLVTVQKQTGYSTADVAKKIGAYMNSEEVKDMGLSMVPLMDQGMYIDVVVSAVFQNLIIGAILAIIILFIFLRDIRPTLVIGISIPISVMFAVVLMYFSGITMNIISLSGLALGVGMLVDNSIVVIENIYRMRGEGKSNKEAAIYGAKQVAGSIIASTLTTICIWIPIIFVQGITRQIFMDLVLTIAYSLIASLIVALTVVPAAAAGVLKKEKVRKKSILDRIIDWYGRVLEKALRRKFIVIILVLVLLIGSFGAVMRKGFEFMGETDSQQLAVNIEMPEGSLLEDSAAMGDIITERIMAIEGVQNVGVMVGNTGNALGGISGNVDVKRLSMYVILEEDRDVTSAEVAHMIEENTKDLDCEVRANASTMDMSALGGSGINVRVKGRELDKLMEISDDVAEILAGIEGTTDVDNGHGDPVNELRISVNKEKAAAHGLTVATVFMQINAKIKDSTTATTLTTEDGSYKITVLSQNNEALTREDIRNLTIEGSSMTGEKEEEIIFLSDIADFEDAVGMAQIQRDGQQRYISVSAGIKEGYNATLLSRELNAKLANYELPKGYEFSFEGENESVMESMKDLLKLLLVGIAIVYLIMVAQFQSLLSPFIVMFTIPLAFTGGLLGLLLTGNIISVIAMIGFVMLCGIIVNNGIVFIDYTNQLVAEGKPVREALIEAGKTRMRPILMTALTTILAMSTMALGIGTGTDMVQPMAIVTIGGLIYGTVLTLVVVPVLYEMFNSQKKLDKKRKKALAKEQADE